MNYDSIGFDLDGTLWDTVPTSAEAWGMVARQYGVYEPTEKQMAGVMGLNEYDLMTKLYPDMSDKDKHEFFEKASGICDETLAQKGGLLYSGMVKTVKKLSKDFKLYIVSNCEPGYIEIFLRVHNLEEFFTDFQWSGSECVPKSENIKSILARNGFKNSIYIGDTQGDRNAAKDAGVPFVYAAYGFGSVDSYDYKIERFEEINEIVYD